MTNKSRLIQIRPGTTTEERYCGECGEFYLLPLPYEQCNPITRDLCTACISDLQRSHER